MSMFLIIVGAIGIIALGFGFFTVLGEKNTKDLFIVTCLWGFFFGLCVLGIRMEDSQSAPTRDQMIKNEYSRCINSYSSTEVLRETKSSREELCMKATIEYKQMFLESKETPVQSKVEITEIKKGD